MAMMTVADFMTRDPRTIQQDSTIYEALALMEEIGCHHLPVMSDDHHLIGVLTAHDCHFSLNLPYTARDQWRTHPQAQQTQVRSTMTPAPIVVEPNASAAEAARLMLVNQISCLPVMRGETLIGILTSSDIFMAFIRCQANEQALSRPSLQ